MPPSPGQSPDYRDPPARSVTEDAATLTPNRARQGVKLGAMRYVLGISTVGTVVILFILYLLVAR